MGSKYKVSLKENRAINAYINFMRAADSVSSRLSRKLAKYNLTMSQLGTLDALYHSGPLIQNELGKKLLKSPGNITMVVDNLERRGLVKRIRNSDDRRAVKLVLTEEGRNFIKEIFPDHVMEIVYEFEVLSEEEQKTLQYLCRKLGKRDQRFTICE